MSVHPDGLQDLVTRAHIARRLHIGRARIDEAVASAGFPAPLGRVGPSPVWRWSEVRSWAEGATGSPGGPSADGMRLAHIRDHFRAAGFRLKITRTGDGWQALRIASGRPSSAGQAFTGASALEAAESALAWLESHH